MPAMPGTPFTRSSHLGKPTIPEPSGLADLQIATGGGDEAVRIWRLAGSSISMESEVDAGGPPGKEFQA
jgi:hypothetical protein